MKTGRKERHEGREKDDLRIRRKREQGSREVERNYEQCANRVRESSFFLLRLCSSRHSSLVFLPSLSCSCLLFNGTRRCSLIDGTGHRPGGAEEGKGRATRERKKEKRQKKSEWTRNTEGGKGDKPLWTTIALFITPGITEFTIKIPRSTALMDRRTAACYVATTPIFSNESVPFFLAMSSAYRVREAVERSENQSCFSFLLSASLLLSFSL